MTESEEELKSLLMKVKEESWFKTQHSKIKIMASSPIISWRTGGETMATVTYFIFLGSNITTDGDCSHEVKRRLIHQIKRKVITNLDSILKSRDITLPTKIHILKAMIFPAVMYGW